MKIKFNDIIFDQLILHSGDIVFDKGKITVITGESGSGKSSLYRLLLNKDYDDIEIYKVLSACAQEPVFIENLTIQQHFSMIQDLNDNILPIDEYIQKLDANNLLSLFPAQLSGGEKNCFPVIYFQK